MKLQSVLIPVFLVGIMTSGVFFEIGEFNFTIERLIGLGLLPMLVYRLLSKGVPAIKRLLWVWITWIGVLFLAALASGDFAAHLPAFLIAIVPIAYFAVITGERVDGKMIHKSVRTVLWVVGVLSLLTIIAYWEFKSAEPLFGMVDSLGRLKLGVVEPNLLGSSMAFLLLLFLPRAKWNMSTIFMYGLALITLLGSASKAPLLAFLLSVCLYGLLFATARRTKPSLALLIPAWLATVSGILILLVLPSVTNIYDKFLDRQDAIISRLYFLRLAFARYWTSPVIGRGPGDFQLQDTSVLWAVGGQGINNLWISQMFVNILHDSGAMGLLVYLTFLSLLLIRGYRWVRAGSLDHCGYMAAFVSVLISSQAATVHLTPIFGIAAALVACRPTSIAAKKSRSLLPGGYQKSMVGRV